MKQDEIEMQLWEYIDGTGNVADMQRISVLIERDPVWQQKYEALQALHTSISNDMEMEQPSMRFGQNVMDAIAAQHIAPATKIYINKSIIRGIAALFILMLTVFFGIACATVYKGGGTSDVLSQLSFSKMNLGKYLNSTTINMILAVNVVIGLVLLDTMLRRRKARHHA